MPAAGPRSEARKAGLKRYFTGVPCPRGHVSERLVSTKACVACRPAYDKKWAEENKDKLRNKAQRKRDRMSGTLNARKRLRYSLDPESFSGAARKWEQRHPEQYRAIRRVITARRRADTLQASPKWLTAEDQALIRFLYDEAVALSLHTGIPFEVDHIVPLRGKAVCGIHVPWNLQVLSRHRNRSKHNKHVG